MSCRKGNFIWIADFVVWDACPVLAAEGVSEVVLQLSTKQQWLETLWQQQMLRKSSSFATQVFEIGTKSKLRCSPRRTQHKHHFEVWNQATDSLVVLWSGAFKACQAYLRSKMPRPLYQSEEGMSLIVSNWTRVAFGDDTTVLFPKDVHNLLVLFAYESNIFSIILPS